MIMVAEPENHTADKKQLRLNNLPQTLQPLERLAWNYWWSWAPDGPAVFRDLDTDIWEQCEQNPRALLAQVSERRLAEMATDPIFAFRVQRLVERFDSYIADTSVSPNLHLTSAITREHPVAYFCAEYGIHNSLPLYSGGLGILAGDYLKSASDLNLPLVAVGLLYRFGYFRQRLRNDGWQEESYRETYASEIPIEPMQNESGEALMIEVAMREHVVRARVWRADIGRVPLYLLDTNLAENEEADRLVTGHLYGGDRETRMVQEMMLGIGGVRLLRKLGIEPSVFHLNEGHSAFLTLELARETIESEHVAFSEVASRVRERCVFTTHTPVAAGHDEFSAALIEKGFGNWYETALGLTRDEFLALGRVNGKADEGFGLTPLALRLCRSTNGVSRKHGEVSRELWHKMFLDRDVANVPITSVTNGVHPATWAAPLMHALYEKHIGDDWRTKARDANVWSDGVRNISDEELWQAHCLLKQRLVAFVRHHSSQTRLARGENEDYINAARTMFDPETLTIGFARRVAGYKRWDLLLSAPERLTRLIDDSERPVQFVFAGKAHPQDQGAKLVLQKLIEWQRESSVRDRVAFIEDYDQEVARQLVQSVDVWMNVPRRPQEASGTSGQKAAVNGGLNFSVFDGWWLEGYDGQNGFAIGDLSELADDEADRRDAESMYRVLEGEIVPRYYDRDADGIPRRWIAMMKRAIQTLVPAFNSDRMVAEYAERIYQPPR
ncbi:MAG TPA: alpha-glucan family phosphorylase [Pyrinomonadaceae bacterium]|nr:alpha-glucan family phosphorylase [Pyrinomonadaceae bacterium]